MAGRRPFANSSIYGGEVRRPGDLLWQQNLNGTANGVNEALSVAVDNLGNVVAPGFTRADFTVAKFEP